MKILKLALVAGVMTYGSLCLAVNDVPNKDEYFMQIAIEHAHGNPKAPFAALIVDSASGEIMGEGLNASHVNPTFHGEMVAINDFAKKHPGADWSKLTLYTTAEPCSMCQSAIVWAGIPRVVFGTSMAKLMALGWGQIAIPSVEVNKKAAFYHGTVTGGVLAEKCDALFHKT